MLRALAGTPPSLELLPRWNRCSLARTPSMEVIHFMNGYRWRQYYKLLRGDSTWYHLKALLGLSDGDVLESITGSISAETFVFFIQLCAPCKCAVALLFVTGI